MIRLLIFTFLLAACNPFGPDPEFYTKKKEGEFFRVPLLPANELRCKAPGQAPWFMEIPLLDIGEAEELFIDSVNVYDRTIIFHSPRFKHGTSDRQAVYGHMDMKEGALSTSVSRGVLLMDMEERGIGQWELQPVDAVFEEFRLTGTLEWIPKED